MKFKFNNNKRIYKIIIILLSVSIFFYSFLYVLNHTKVDNLIINTFNKGFSNDFIIKTLSKSELVYSSLNKVVDYSEESIEIDDVEEIDDIFVIEQKEYKDPIIYIYNTHQTEGYSYKMLDHTVKPTVLFASYILKDYLNDLGIESVIETNSMKSYLLENNLKYSDSYEASRHYIKKVIDEYKSIKYYIDLHRDSARINKTLYENNNKRYARIMFVVGMNHNNSNSNMNFIKKINDKIDKKYKGLSRGIYKRNDARFNQDISEKAFLIELGGVDNTLEEINNTLEVLANILSEEINDGNT